MAEDRTVPISSAGRQMRFRAGADKITDLLPIIKIRQVQRAIKNAQIPEMVDEVPVKRKEDLQERTFYYGFRKGIKEEESGKRRELWIPHPSIALVCESLHFWLGKNFQPHNSCYGFVEKRNPIKVAKKFKKKSGKIERNHFVTLDIADAFPSITTKMVEKALVGLKMDELTAEVLAWLVTFDYKGKRCLPMGAPSSPSLLNLVYKSMLKEIDKICRKEKIVWVIYADDMTFTGNEITEEFEKNVISIVEKYDFKINLKKRKDNGGNTIAHFLGLTVNPKTGKIDIRKGLKKKYVRIFYQGWKHGKYTIAEVEGIANAIKAVYGKEKKWPPWLLKHWLKFKEVRMGGELR